MPLATQPLSHLLSLSSLSPAQFDGLIDLSLELKADPFSRGDALKGRSVLLIFTKPSARTRISFEAAIARLGGTTTFVGDDKGEFGVREPLRDVARVAARYCAAVVIRTHAHGDVEEFAAWSDAPVINGLTDDHHPCQALADLMTIRERFGRTKGVEVAFVGDGASNVCHSLVQGCALAGAHIRVGAPAGFTPSPEVLEAARAVAAVTGSRITVFDDPAEAVSGADIVYTDVHVSMGEEGLRQQKLDALARYRVDDALLARAADHAAFMHCLPAHRGEEVTDGVLEGRQSVVWDQAENRMHTAAAILVALTGSP